MPKIQYKFDFAPRTMLRLEEIEEIIREYRIMRTPPSRDALIAMCQDGTLEANKTRFGYLVFEDSFDGWVRSLQQRMAA